MTLLEGIGCLATPRTDGTGRPVRVVRDAAVAWREGRIEWAGPRSDLPSEFASDPAVDAGGGLVVPGLVDCHTHLAFAGWRADEFRRRVLGESYREIAASGGGIAATVERTREAGEEELLARCRGFLSEMLSLGVTTVEAKSGYGLQLEAERKLLRVYRRLDEEGPQRIVPTFLGAHVVPPEFRDARDEYVDLLVEGWIPAVAGEGLARHCDVFLEEGAFGAEEARRILAAAKEAGLAARLHADQLSDGGGAALGAGLGAASVDHLEHVSEEGIRALAGSETVAVLLPFASLYLGQPPAPGRRLVEAGARVAVATDFNPGTAPSYHLPVALTLACLREGLTPEEALRGATLEAARAVGLEDEIGSIEPGKRADLAVIDAGDPDQWLYHLRPNACVMALVGGEVAWSASGEDPSRAEAT